MANPIEELRKTCLDRGVNGIRMIGRTFRIIDSNGSRSLDREELQSGLREFGVSMSRSRVEELFQYLDKDGSGSVSFDEFLEALRPPMSKARLNVIGQAFEKLDKTKDGVITVDDLRLLYNVEHHPKYKSGEMSRDQILREFMDTFQQGGVLDDQVTREEFVNYYSGVSASIDDDQYFVLMMKQAWKL